MYLSLRNLRNLYAAIMKLIPKFEASFAILLIKIDQIQMVSEKQGINKTGLTEDKNTLKKNLIALTVKFANKLSILAKLNKNQTLFNEVKLRESSLETISGVTLRDKAQVIYDRAQANIGSLEEQGITADTQKAFLEMIQAFNNALSTPRTGIAEKAQATKSLLLLYDEADASIEIMDLAAESAKDEYPDFFSAYKTSRILVDNNTSGLRLKATAIDLSSKEPLKGVFFRFRYKGLKSGGNTGNGDFTKKTAKKGGFTIKNMDPGTYTVLVTKPGYKDQDVTVTISDGERSELKVELEKV